MHAPRQRAAGDVGDHQPAALAEKRRVRLVVNRRNFFGAAHWPRRLAEAVESGKNLFYGRGLVWLQPLQAILMLGVRVWLILYLSNSLLKCLDLSDQKLGKSNVNRIYFTRFGMP